MNDDDFQEEAAKADAVRLFELGSHFAARLDHDKAMDYFTRSISAYGNCLAYVGRAELFSNRIRHYEAALDLKRAKSLVAPGNELDVVIEVSLRRSMSLSQYYHNGMRERLLNDYAENDVVTVAGKIAHSAFDIGEHFTVGDSRAEAEYHVFKEMISILRYEDLAKLPEVGEYLKLYKLSFIIHKVESQTDTAFYDRWERNLHAYLCCFDISESRLLRRNILWYLHQELLRCDYGDIYSLDSEAKETIKEAGGYR